MHSVLNAEKIEKRFGDTVISVFRSMGLRSLVLGWVDSTHVVDSFHWHVRSTHSSFWALWKNVAFTAKKTGCDLSHLRGLIDHYRGRDWTVSQLVLDTSHGSDLTEVVFALLLLPWSAHVVCEFSNARTSLSLVGLLPARARWRWDPICKWYYISNEEYRI